MTASTRWYLAWETDRQKNGVGRGRFVLDTGDYLTALETYVNLMGQGAKHLQIPISDPLIADKPWRDDIGSLHERLDKVKL